METAVATEAEAEPEAVEPADPLEPYPLEEAVADALSGPLTYIGGGRWYGINRTKACAYRNDRVIVVDIYCTRREVSSFRVDVFSPTRGWTRIYAEADAPISALERNDYQTFRAFSEPAPAPGRLSTQLALTSSYEELQAYNKARYDATLPTCWGGVEAGRAIRGCGFGLEPYTSRYSARNGQFFEQPPASWYRLVRHMVEAREHREPPSQSLRCARSTPAGTACSLNDAPRVSATAISRLRRGAHVAPLGEALRGGSSEWVGGKHSLGATCVPSHT